MECIELNWMCKHVKKVRSSKAVVLVLNWVKHSFSLWVSLKAYFNLLKRLVRLFLYNSVLKYDVCETKSQLTCVQIQNLNKRTLSVEWIHNSKNKSLDFLSKRNVDFVSIYKLIVINIIEHVSIQRLQSFVNTFSIVNFELW